MYLLGALGVESVSAWYTDNYRYGDLIYLLITTVEEVLEIAGLIGFLYTLLSYIKRTIGPCWHAGYPLKVIDEDPTPGTNLENPQTSRIIARCIFGGGFRSHSSFSMP